MNYQHTLIRILEGDIRRGEPFLDFAEGSLNWWSHGAEVRLAGSLFQYLLNMHAPAEGADCMKPISPTNPARIPIVAVALVAIEDPFEILDWLLSIAYSKPLGH